MGVGPLLVCDVLNEFVPFLKPLGALTVLAGREVELIVCFCPPRPVPFAVTVGRVDRAGLVILEAFLSLAALSLID